MNLEKQITYRGHRWNEVMQDYDLSDSSGVRYLSLRRPISVSAIRRNGTFVSAISVQMASLLADPKVSDEIIFFCDQLMTRRIRKGAFVATEDLKALCHVTVNSTTRRELEKQMTENCPYCTSAESGHNVHCRNFREAINV